MGTATTMNSLAEALGMQLPGTAAIPAPYRQRGHISYQTGQRIVEMVHEDLKPSDIMTRAAFENAIVVNSAIGGSTNAPIHLNAIARHMGVPLDNDDWQALGHDMPLLTNLQPAGEYLGEDYYHAGGVPAVIGQLIAAGMLPHPRRHDGERQDHGRELRGQVERAARRHPPIDAPMLEAAGFLEPEGQPLRQRDHEDLRDLEGIPRPLPVEPGRSRRVRGARRRVRRAGGLPREDRRRSAWDR